MNKNIVWALASLPFLLASCGGSTSLSSSNENIGSSLGGGSSFSSSGGSSSFSFPPLDSGSYSSYQPSEDPVLTKSLPTSITLDSSLIISDGVSSLPSGLTIKSQGLSSSASTLSLSQKGFLTNLEAYSSFTSLTVTFTSPDYSFLYAKSSYYPIDDYVVGGELLESGVSYSFENEGARYFSLYSAIGTFEISSVVITSALYENPEQKASKGLDIYSINDTHGAVDSIPNVTAYQCGTSYLGSYLRKQGNANPDGTIILSSGDMLQGSADSNMTHGAVMLDWMNVVGFTSMALGNHEFDWGKDILTSASKMANFPFLAINLLNDEGVRPSFAKKSLVLRKAGYRIGVIGALGNIESSIVASMFKGFHIDLRLSAMVSREAERLRVEEGCDLVVLSIHSGSFITDDCHNIDAVFEGHSHESYLNVDSYGIPHVQTTDTGKVIRGLHFEEKDGKLAYTNSYLAGKEEIVTNGSVDPASEKVRLHYLSLIDSVKNKVLCTSAVSYSTSELATIAAKEMYSFYKAKPEFSNIVASIINTGTVRNPIQKGEITYGDVYSAFPFDNDNVLDKIEGSALKTLMKNSSLADYSEMSEFKDGTIYEVVVISYVSEKDIYADYFEEISRDAENRLRDIVAAYFEKLGQ